jgi:hypothetical protein
MVTNLGGCAQPKVDMSLVKEEATAPILPRLRSDAAFEMAEETGVLVPKDSENKSLGSTEESWREYRELSAYYRKAFEVYALKTLRLDLLDKELKNSNLGFVLVPEEKRSEQQNNTSLKLDCLYIYSRGYNIEYMSQEDIDTLRRLEAENKTVITDEALELISRSFKDVIRQYDSLNGQPYPDDMMRDMPGSTSGVGTNLNSLIIMVPNVEIYGDDGSEIPENAELYAKREKYLLKRLPELYDEYTEKLGMKVNFIITYGGRGSKLGLKYDLNTSTYIEAVVGDEFARYTIGSWGIHPEPSN